MSNSEKPLFNRQTISMDLVLTAVVFVFFTAILRANVPAENPAWVLFWAAFTALPMSGVAFLCIQMFRAVLTDQRRRVRAETE
jgi:RsiW-degrading membrane proteinase PrsW (M82 family)